MFILYVLIMMNIYKNISPYFKWMVGNELVSLIEHRKI